MRTHERPMTEFNALVADLQELDARRAAIRKALVPEYRRPPSLAPMLRDLRALAKSLSSDRAERRAAQAARARAAQQARAADIAERAKVGRVRVQYHRALAEAATMPPEQAAGQVERLRIVARHLQAAGVL